MEIYTKTVTQDDEFILEDVPFKVYGQVKVSRSNPAVVIGHIGLWVDGGDFDDFRICDLPQFDHVEDYDTEVEITITAAQLREARDYLTYLAEDDE